VRLVVLQWGVVSNVEHSVSLTQPQVPVSVWQIGVEPAQTVSLSQPVCVALQSCWVLPSQWCAPVVQVSTGAATHTPFVQTGVAGVAAQSDDPEHPHIPVEVRHFGVVPLQVASLTHPVRVSLQICCTSP
jgi:hypothetical protein